MISIENQVEPYNLLLLELNNITEIINESKSNDETLYELIDTKDNLGYIIARRNSYVTN